MARPEGQVEDFFCRTFRLGGWKVYKCAWGGGAYDRLAISPKAFHLYVEIKKPGKNVLDPAQIAWRDDMLERIGDTTRKFDIALAGPINCREQVRALYAKYRDY